MNLETDLAGKYLSFFPSESDNALAIFITRQPNVRPWDCFFLIKLGNVLDEKGFEWLYSNLETKAGEML